MSGVFAPSSRSRRSILSSSSRAAPQPSLPPCRSTSAPLTTSSTSSSRAPPGRKWHTGTVPGLTLSHFCEERERECARESEGKELQRGRRMVKAYIIDILKRSSGIWASELVSNLDVFWDNIESSLSKSSPASYFLPLQQFLFTFLCKVLAGADASRDPKIAESGHIMLDRWLALQLLPITSIGILQPLEEIFLHSFAYPSFLVSGDYNNLYNFVKQQGKDTINRGEIGFGLTQEEAIHNLLFVLGFNSFGGFTIFLPALFGAIAKDPALQEKLKKEARENGGSTLSFDSVKEMPLVQSVVYETLRMSPPVPLQFGRARKDFRLTSHDSVFDVKKGELLCGFQKIVMRDSLIFDEPDLFKPDRFTEEKGAKLLDYLYWSNGPQSGSPTLSNKQCAGKDVVTLTAALIVAHLFRRYDSITGDGGSITALQKPK
ncbi:hydroperoxide lyase [Vigna unguiculata]|uniref:Hydroperoxide lyase n=1 Tax=Vigna unguiculata TaxID=3917 RepID=A0A4D6N6T8_VIGUN|nr:hydroperoxide lyase [Vigna unguiculata]